MVTANITTWSKHGVDVYGLGMDIVALQEHCIRKGNERAARAEAIRGGYRLWLGEAPDRGAPNTTHAGTAVLTRLDLPALPLGRGEGELKGRWSSVRIGGGLQGEPSRWCQCTASSAKGSATTTSYS